MVRDAGSSSGRSSLSVPDSGDSDRPPASAAATSAWARNSPATKRSGASADGAWGASSAARVARRRQAAATSSVGSMAILTRDRAILAGDLAEPATVMQPRPAPVDGAAGHRVEGARLGGGAEVDVEDDGHEEQRHHGVVQQDRRLAQEAAEPAEQHREPEDDAGDEQCQRAQADGEEEQLLAAVVLADLFVLARELQILNQLRTEPAFVAGL